MPHPEARRGKRALYFEDQPDKVRDISNMLRLHLRLELKEVDNPDDAFTAMKEAAFDLIVLDIRILDGDRRLDGTDQDWRRYGIYFLRALREGLIDGPTPPGVPVLVITCVVSTPDVDEIGRLGESANGTYRYLAKPVNLDDVEEAVKKLLGK